MDKKIQNKKYAKQYVKKPIHRKRIAKDQLSCDVVMPRLKRKVMRFGQYKNYEFVDIPSDYLKWAVLNIKNSEIVDDLTRELQRRDSYVD